MPCCGIFCHTEPATHHNAGPPIGRLCQQTHAGRQKAIFSASGKARFGRFLRVLVQTGFIRSAQNLEKKRAKHVISKTLSPIFDFRPETRDIPTRVKNGAAFYKPSHSKRISSERDKKSKLGDNLFQINILEVQKIIRCDPPNNSS